MKQVILFLLFFVQVAVFGQKQVKNANKAFQKESYIAASKIYEDAVNNGDVTPELLRNLGDSYYYNARYAEAAPWYAKLFQLSSDQTAEYYFRYAQSLKSAQQAERSDSVMAVYCSKFPMEIRAKNYRVKQNYLFENNPFLAIRLKNLEINTAYSDYGATIDGDSIYFASARPEILDPEEYERTQQPFTNLFVAKFIDTTVYRSKIYDNGKTFSVFHEATPVFSSDGKTMYYTKNELVSKKNKTLVNGRYRIYKSIFENGKWIDKGVVNIKTNDSCRIAHPALSPDNKRLYFSSDMKGTYGQSDIFYVDLFDNDSVSLPVNLGTRINTEGRDSYPFVSQDNQLFFASEGHPGMGGFDVFVIDLNATGTTPKNLAAPINSVDDDFAFVWKKDLYKAVLTSNRLGGKGDDDIYAFALPKPIEQVVPVPTAPAAIFAMGKVTDSKTGAVLANSTVTVTDATGKVVATVSTDAEGNYNFPIVSGQSYQLAYVSNGYESAQQTLTIPATQTANSSVNQQLTQVPTVIEPVTPVVLAPTEPITIGTDLAKVFAINPIYFDVNKAIIRPDAALELDKIVAFMNEHPELEIELGSHTDCRSSASYNKSLSDRRAKASAAYIKARIKHPERIKGKGYGESQLLNNCFCEDSIKSTCSEEEHQLNRRTEFKVVGIKTEQQPISESGGNYNPIVQQTKPKQTSGATKPFNTVTPSTNQEVVSQSEIEKTPPVSFELGTDLAKLYAINPIYFDVNRAIIRPDAALELDKIAAIMNEHPELEIELGSHTDCRSTVSYNQSLSNRRAKASAAYIKARIKHPERIKGKGYGESQLLNNCFCEDTIESSCSDEEHQLNRRTEFKIVGLNGEKKGKNVPVDTTTSATTLDKIPKVVKKPIKASARLKDSIPTVYPAGFELGADLTKLLQINMIYFDLDKYNIRPEAALELDKIVAVMKQYPNMKIELTSHTDCRMPADYNQRLSNNRARTSKSYLVAHGIKSSRIVGKGLGETQLAVNCPCEGEESSLCTEEQHQLNRRTEFIIISL